MEAAGGELGSQAGVEEGGLRVNAKDFKDVSLAVKPQL